MQIARYFLILLVVLGLGSCENFLDVNQNPNTPQSSEAHILLPPILAQMVRGEAFDSRYAGQYVQYWASTSSSNVWDRHGYAAGTDFGGEKWRQHYFGIGKNIDLVIADGVSKGKWDYVGVAKAIRAWSWQTTTDFHGEMILKQAFEEGRYAFDFDSQAEVYQEVVRLGQEALQDLERTDGLVSQPSLARGDLVYNGDRSKWIKFIYAVLARNAHHQSNKSSYNPDQVIEYIDKSFSTNADNFEVPHLGSIADNANFYGPLRDNVSTLRFLRQTNYMVSLLNGTIFSGVKDPRLPLMLAMSPDSTFRGITPNLGDPSSNQAATSPTKIPTVWGNAAPPYNNDKFIFRNEAPHPLITYFELQFMKAEAAFIKGDKATALMAYQNGIQAHMDFVQEVTPNAASAKTANYMTSEAVAQTADDLTLSDIMLQKYIALWVHGALETWVDMRRYGYSSTVYTGFTPPTNLFPDNNGKLAQRARPRYNSEYVWNFESLRQIGADQPDYHTLEMWFSKPE